jgi:hypothetical protein
MHSVRHAIVERAERGIQGNDTGASHAHLEPNAANAASLCARARESAREHLIERSVWHARLLIIGSA